MKCESCNKKTAVLSAYNRCLDCIRSGRKSKRMMRDEYKATQRKEKT